MKKKKDRKYIMPKLSEYFNPEEYNKMTTINNLQNIYDEFDIDTEEIVKLPDHLQIQIHHLMAALVKERSRKFRLSAN